MAKDGDERLYTQADVDRMIAPLLERIAELEAKIARLTRDSRTSSKPPSSDVIKTTPTGPKGKRKPGGQKGHPKNERVLFPPEQVDEVYEYELVDMTGLRPLTGDAGWRIVQQIELVDKPYRIIEHRVRRYVKMSTGRIVTAALPDEIRRGGLLGPKLTGLIAYLKGPCHLSYRSIELFFNEVMGLTLSVGVLVKAVAKATEALAEPYEQLLAVLPRQPVLGIDETGHRHRGQRCWTWCLHAPGLDGITCFVIDTSRGSSVVKELIGSDYAGIVICDYFSAYRKCLADMDNLIVQFCWAHLVRDVMFLAEHPDKVIRRYGAKVLAPVRKLFRLLARRGLMIGIYVVLIWLALMYKWLREGGSGLSVFLVGTLTTLIFFALAACCGLPAVIKLFSVRLTMDETGLRFDGLSANAGCTWSVVDRLIKAHMPQRFSELQEGITLMHANRRLALPLWMFDEAQQREIFDLAAQYIKNRAIQRPDGPTSHSLRT